MTAVARYRHLGTDHGVVARLPTDLVVRYRAVDREAIHAPSAVVDTPAHLDRLGESIAADGIRVPLRMGFNSSYGYLAATTGSPSLSASACPMSRSSWSGKTKARRGATASRCAQTTSTRS